MKRLYYIKREWKKAPIANCFCGIFESEQSAVREAEIDWKHLTPSEQAGTIIRVFYADVPDDITISKAYDYILGHDCGGYSVTTFRV